MARSLLGFAHVVWLLHCPNHEGFLWVSWHTITVTDVAENVRWLMLSSHFPLLSVTPAPWIFQKILTENEHISTMAQGTSWLERMVSICCWECSRTLAMPKCSLLKCYLPKGLMKVVSCLQLSFRGIYQNHKFASILLKTVAPANCARKLAAFGKGWVSLNTFLCEQQKVRTNPYSFGSTTISVQCLGSPHERWHRKTPSWKAPAALALFRVLLCQLGNQMGLELQLNLVGSWGCTNACEYIWLWVKD